MSERMGFDPSEGLENNPSPQPLEKKSRFQRLGREALLMMGLGLTAAQGQEIKTSGPTNPDNNNGRPSQVEMASNPEVEEFKKYYEMLTTGLNKLVESDNFKDVQDLLNTIEKFEKFREKYNTLKPEDKPGYELSTLNVLDPKNSFLDENLQTVKSVAKTVDATNRINKEIERGTEYDKKSFRDYNRSLYGEERGLSAIRGNLGFLTDLGTIHDLVKNQEK